MPVTDKPNQAIKGLEDYHPDEMIPVDSFLVQSLCARWRQELGVIMAEQRYIKQMVGILNQYQPVKKLGDNCEQELHPNPFH